MCLTPIDAASNLNPLGPGEKSIQALRSSILLCGAYPEITSHHLTKHISSTCDVDLDQIIVGNGSSELIDLIIRAFGRDSMVVCDKYGFFGFSRIANANKRIVCEVSGSEPFNTSVDDFISFTESKTVLLFLDNPSNPGGNIRSIDQIIKLSRSLNPKSILVIDEAYIEYLPTSNSSIRLVDELDNVVVLRTFSKAYGLAGVRAGYAVSSKEVINKINSYCLRFNVNIFAQNAAIAALYDLQHLYKTRQLTEIFHQFMSNEFDKLEIEHSVTSPSFITLFINKKSASTLQKCFLDNRILVNNMSDRFQNGVIRISLIEENNFHLVSQSLLQFHTQSSSAC